MINRITHSLIKQITEQLSNSSLEEERIKELCPVNLIWDYYDNPTKINVGEKKYTIKWKDEESRIKEINRINKIIAEYSGTKEKPPIKPIRLWAFNCYPKHEVNPNSTSNQIEDLKYWTVDDEELFKTHVEIGTGDFTEYLNKEIFNYVQKKVQSAIKKGAWDKTNMWFEPNIKFLEWFDSKGIDTESKSGGILSPRSKWAKEVVNLLKEHGEMKNIDIILALDDKGMSTSYNHISQIFKSKSDRKFYNEELVNNGAYWSLKSKK
jgi:hypothetical protein